MDMHMPRSSGRDVVRKIRDAEGGQQVTIVGMTGQTEEENRQMVLQCGCNEYLPKPFRIADLYGIFQRHPSLRFIDEEAESQPPNSRQLFERSLSPDWWASLKEANALGDIARIRSLADEAEPQAPDLAAALRALATRFDLRGIRDLIQRGSGKWST
jgi:CheY-like chemotaxis protein